MLVPNPHFQEQVRREAEQLHLHRKAGGVLAQQHVYILKKVLEDALFGTHFLPHRLAKCHLLVPGRHCKH